MMQYCQETISAFDVSRGTFAQDNWTKTIYNRACINRFE